MPHPVPSDVRRGTALLITLLVASTIGLAGCGGGDQSAAGPSSTGAAAAATPQEAATTWPPQGSSGALATYLYKYGVSWRVPRAWKLSVDVSGGSDTYTWDMAKKKVGLSVTVQNSRSTVPEWRAIVQESRTDQKKVLQESVSVPGYGRGSHTRSRADGVTDDLLIVTSIDGVLLQMDVFTRKGSDPATADAILASLRRTT